ncbi:TPM domain-containing protein [Sphingomonas sp. CCH18-H6]|uniref:TPM domain-containing protein n=2 Tax=unclassified Sphingomonas TaxID=196159 RepID=UPI000832199E|nr:TPM domain-containing protein [Sphingomonas sp. CCH18-H6]
MTLRRLAAGLWLMLLVAVMPAAAQTFPTLTGRVVDAANLLDADQKARLSALSAEIEQASSRQFVVATVPSLQDYPIEEYGYRLGRAWKIGQGEANNGIILLIAPNERKVRIEVGYGLEPIMTDALASVIINQTILPRFKAGDLPGGILAGAEAIGEQMRLPLEVAEQRAVQQTARAQSSRKRDGIPVALIFWGVVLIFIVLPILFGGPRGRRYRRGGAPVVIWGPGWGSGSSWGGGSSPGGSPWSGGSSWGGGGGFSGGGGSFGGGGASGGW